MITHLVLKRSSHHRPHSNPPALHWLSCLHAHKSEYAVVLFLSFPCCHNSQDAIRTFGLSCNAQKSRPATPIELHLCFLRSKRKHREYPQMSSSTVVLPFSQDLLYPSRFSAFCPPSRVLRPLGSHVLHTTALTCAHTHSPALSPSSHHEVSKGCP